ncbi:hypothetical protein NMG60_11009199 [Bertholletia excelsa]
MAETPLKRQREETLVSESMEHEDPKRQKSYTHIISLLEDEEDETNQDFSSILTTLQHELSEPDPDLHETSGSGSPEFNPASHGGLKGEEEEEEGERERVMKHLLEASDDELGIPNKVDGRDDDVINGGDGLPVIDGFWEFEDEAANYYTLLQSELFM